MINRRRFFNAMFAPAVLSAVGKAKAAPYPAAAPDPYPPMPEPEDPQYWDHIREQFYLNPEEAYFNTATIGAVPRPVLERVIEDMRVLQATLTLWDFKPGTPDWISGYSPMTRLRAKLARLVNVEGRDIALTQNSTFGMNFVANGIDLKRGAEVILTDREHPGGICGWQERAKKDGIVVKQVHLPTPANDPDHLVQLFADAITPRTRVLAFAHVIFSSGIVMPAKQLTKLAHDKGCLSVIDGAQATGHIKVDLQDIGCDAYFSSPHKWLLAPPGNGYVYMKRDLQQRVWTTLASYAWGDDKDGMFRFMQYGTGNRSLLVGLDAALDFHFQIGHDRWINRIRFLADRLRSGLQHIPGAVISSPVNPELAGAVVLHRIQGVTAEDLQDQLWIQKRIRVRSEGEDVGVRQACEIFNSEAEIDSTLDLVRKLASKA